MLTLPDFPIGLDVNWQSSDAVSEVDGYLANWLVDTGSLTERIQSMCRQFSVQVVGQGTASLYPAEQDLLPLSAEHYDVREVVLTADGSPWVFARSVIPKILTQGEWSTLGSSPLGKQLFNDSRFVRGAFEIAQIESAKFHWLGDTSPSPSMLFGRRSAFHFAAQDIIVAEVFLPGSPVYQGVTP